MSMLEKEETLNNIIDNSDYSDANPMDCMFPRYDGDKIIQYRYKFRGNHGQNKDKKQACDELRDKIVLDSTMKEMQKLDNIDPIKMIIIGENTFFVYGTLEEPLFDYFHILHYRGIKITEKFKNRIWDNKRSHFGYFKNQFGGYVFRFYVPIDCGYEILNEKEHLKTISKKLKEKILPLKNKQEIAKKTKIIEKKEEVKMDVVKDDKKEDIKISEELKQMEEQLDNEIDIYTRRTIKNPFDGISLYKKRYRLGKGKYFDKSELTEVILTTIKTKMGRNSDCLQTIPYIHNLHYQDKNILIYNSLQTPYFDIRHIIHLFNNKDWQDNNIYNNNKDEIKARSLNKNSNGGYFVREFISRQTMFDMILASNKAFSKKFKKDISKELDRLAGEGNLEFKNDGIKIRSRSEFKYIPPKEKILVNHNENGINFDFEPMTPPNNQSNEEFIAYTKKLAKMARDNIDVSDFADCGVMYYAFTSLPDKRGKNQLIVKIGYTENLEGRLASLDEEYKCKYTLVACIKVKTKTVETKFHKMAHNTYPSLCYTIEINGKRKNELYVHDQCLLDKFLSINKKMEQQEYLKPVNENISLEILKEQNRSKEALAKNNLEVEKQKTQQLQLQLELAKLQKNKSSK